MTAYRGAAVHTQESVTQSIAAGRSFIDKCVRLDERMEDVDRLAAQLAIVDRALRALETSFQAEQM